MRPAVLVDTAVLDGSARAFPLAWLDGCDVRPYPPRGLAACRSADALVAQAVVVRSMTRVGRPELAVLPALGAVATLSSGTDHLDEPALVERGVHLCTGHGGNARAVADWVQWALERLAPPRSLSVLVVGAGAVGGLVTDRLLAAGHTVWPCDPLLASDPATARRRPWVELDEGLLRDPDIVTLHVPLTKAGVHATQGLLDERRLAAWARPGRMLFNAARGGVLHELSAAQAAMAGQLHLAFDTFVGEPQPDLHTLNACALATPHIAGHSLEGKLDVARRAIAALRARLGLSGLPPLRDLVNDAIAALPGVDLQPNAALDRCATALKEAPATFEQLRHRHLRCERLRLPG